MVWAEESLVIGRSCDVVFALVSDVPRMPAWRSTVLAAAWRDEGPPRVGRPMRAVTKVAGRRFAWACEVTEWDPPRLFGYTARGVGGNRQEVSAIFRLDPVAGGCRLRMAGGGELPGRVAGLAAPVLVRMLLRENRAALGRLKLLAEEPAGP